jgi:hypothetical protein
MSKQIPEFRAGEIPKPGQEWEASSAAPTLDKKPSRGWRYLALTLWLIPFLVISVMAFSRPHKRTVTPLYHEAVQNWSRQATLYDGPQGMNYLPTFVPLFAPYHMFPVEVAGVLWRATAFAGFCLGLWWFARSDERNIVDRSFALLTLLALPLCLGALRNGQANAHLGAALLLAAGCLLSQRWWLATLFLSLAVAIKPLGLAGAGLAFAVFPHLWWRLGIGVTAILVMPFLFGPWSYVASQYADAFNNLRQCSEVTEHRFADLNGLLRTFGMGLTSEASLLVRASAGLLFAGFCFGWVRRLQGRERALGWLAFSAGFLMLFNPMNESNSYAILGPALGLWAWQFGITGRRRIGILLVAAIFTMSVLPNVLRPWLGNAFALAWHPSMTTLFIAVLAFEIFRKTCMQHKPALENDRLTAC